MTNSLDTSEAEARPWMKPAQPAPGEEGAPTLTKEEMALGAFLAAMHDSNLDGGKMREAMLNVLGPTDTQQAAPSQGAGERICVQFESKFSNMLQAAWVDGWGACRDSEFIGSEAMQDAFNRCNTLSLCVAIDQSDDTALLEASAQREQPAAMPPLKKDDIEFVLKNFSKRISDLQQEVESGCIGLKIGIEKLHDRLLPNAPSLNESEAFEQSKVPDRIIEQPAASKPRCPLNCYEACVAQTHGCASECPAPSDFTLRPKMPEPQAQAGEPEVVAYAGNNGELFPTTRGYDVLRVGDELITLKSYREAMATIVATNLVNKEASLIAQHFLAKAHKAIAKKDAALKACVDVLAVSKNGLIWYRDRCQEAADGSDDEIDAEIDAAITQGQEALK